MWLGWLTGDVHSDVSSEKMSKPLRTPVGFEAVAASGAAVRRGFAARFGARLPDDRAGTLPALFALFFAGLRAVVFFAADFLPVSVPIDFFAVAMTSS